MRLLFAAMLLWIAGGAAAAADSPSDKALTTFFESVVFGAEYKDVAKGSTVIKKWVEPIRINVTSIGGKMIDKPDGGKELKLAKRKPSKTEVALIRKHFGRLLKITGLKTESAKKSGKKPNLFIKFVPRRAMHAPFLVPGVDKKMLRRLAAPGVCYFLTAAKQGRIIWGTIVVNGQLPERDMDACLMEELTQALGLPNDSDIVKPSMFNNRAQPTAINRTDAIMIRTLYDKRLQPGMPRDKAMATAARLIAAWNKKLPKTPPK